MSYHEWEGGAYEGDNREQSQTWQEDHGIVGSLVKAGEHFLPPGPSNEPRRQATDRTSLHKLYFIIHLRLFLPRSGRRDLERGFFPQSLTDPQRGSATKETREKVQPMFVNYAQPNKQTKSFCWKLYWWWSLKATDPFDTLGKFSEFQHTFSLTSVLKNNRKKN